MKNIKSSLLLLCVFVFIISFLEITFKTRLLYLELRIGQLFTLNVLRNMLFTVTYGLFTMTVFMFFGKKMTRVLFVLATATLIGLYFSQDIYFLIANNFYSFTITGEIAKGFTFLYRLPQTLSFGHLFYFMPLIFIVVLIVLDHRNNLDVFEIKYVNYKQPLAFLLIAFLSLFMTMQTISAQSDEEEPYSYSDYDLYVQPLVPHSAMRKFGVLSYIRVDIQNAIIPVTPEDDDFDIFEFIESNPKHEINDMTGVFEDKNFIMIMAEALDTYAIDRDLTPNLYRLKQASWSFDNFYAPLYYRNTADTEFMVQTGFYPNKNIQLSMSTYGDNTFPYTLPKLFSEQGHKTLAFHNFSDHFYPREQFHPHTIGYDEYYGDERLGLTIPNDEERLARGHYWHSDLEMIENALPIILEEDQFFAYFLTVTGHLPYEETRHDYAVKHYPTIEAILEYTGREDMDESLKYYHASQWEFDLAIGHLLDTLEANNRLDDTVIMIFGDHYAYGLEQSVIWDYDTVKDDTTPLNIHKVPMMMYHPSLTPQTFDPVFSPVDILPTLANMFNLDLNYQWVMGQDAFNDNPNTIIFSTTSFLSEDYYYEVERDLFVIRNDTLIIEDPRSLIGFIMHRINMNNFILNNDVFAPLVEPEYDRDEWAPQSENITPQ